MCWSEENAMHKPISTKTHGAIDYAWSATAAALPSAMNGSTATAKLVRAAATAAAMTSMCTNYEWGRWRVLSMKVHLAIDFLMCGALVASPLFLPASERRYARIPMALGAVGLMTGLMTQTRSPLEVDEEFGGFVSAGQISSAAELDPDLAQSPHLRLHLE
jgi:hypothetical protein